MSHRASAKSLFAQHAIESWSDCKNLPYWKPPCCRCREQPQMFCRIPTGSQRHEYPWHEFFYRSHRQAWRNAQCHGGRAPLPCDRSSSGGSPPETGSSGERENQRPSTSWASPTTVGNATRAEPSPYGGSLRRSEWLRSSKPSRLSFNAGCMIAWPMSVHGSGRLCWAITNTTLFPGTRLSCASSNFACAGYGRVFWSAAVSAQRCVGNVLPQS